MDLTSFLTSYKEALLHNPFMILVLICVVADTVFGCLRAAKYHAWNSSLGIDGGIRKVTMLLSVVFLALVDQIVGVNLISWLPEAPANALNAININAIGLAEFFCLVYILYEATSILKNMLLCGVPAPAGLQDKLAGWLDQMTDESSVSIVDTLAQPSHKQVPKKKA